MQASSSQHAAQQQAGAYDVGGYGGGYGQAGAYKDGGYGQAGAGKYNGPAAAAGAGASAPAQAQAAAVPQQQLPQARCTRAGPLPLRQLEGAHPI